MDYIRTKAEKKLPQLLQVEAEDGLYRTAILHANVCEKHSIERYRAPSPHNHDVYHFVIYVSGKNQFQWREKEWEGKRGVLALVGPGETHDFGPRVKGAFSYAEVTFQLESGSRLLDWPFHALLSALSGISLTPVESTFELTERQTRTAERNIGAIVDGMKDGGESGVYDAYLALSEILQNATRLCWHPKMEIDVLSANPLEAARRRIEKNFCGHLLLEDIAAFSNLSKSHFCRSFSKAFGMSPIAYQIELRIRAAEVLLRTTNLRGKEIAPLLGFSDEYAFSKAFKKARGIPPGKYRSR